MPFRNNNVASGVPKNSPFLVGRSNVDVASDVPERGIGLPWASDSEASWMYYECSVGVFLDSGIVVHNRLPQFDYEPDTLASCRLDDPRLDAVVVPGVNLKCRDQYQDVVQRMGHARYWFRLWGQALRVGYQVPIPGLVRVGGVAVIPYDRNPQWAYCGIAPGGNYSGVVLWRAAWTLWYTTAAPPQKNDIPAVDLAAHISGAIRQPGEVQAPYASPDDDATPNDPRRGREVGRLGPTG